MSSEPFKGKGLKVSNTPNAPANPPPVVPSSGPEPPKPGPPPRAEEISSPHELTAFVEHILGQLEGKFDDMSGQILEKMNQMSARVDTLETSIQDLLNADLGIPQSPSPFQGSGSGSNSNSGTPTPATIRKSTG
ncbi:hypothetical protein M422DRAFT_37840 [Sphaerobolus stellatus SS14]|uniref:Heat shock factor-binding protein 1 n=1 Tax=Sphaerobolus stellatus (strain SS14) TaxID=990650 RepID=A0A0C9TZV5_SPHS4|nr:hypothetical protein M422DRAFT_37840 [Sphaerobolus stellatus SS14]